MKTGTEHTAANWWATGDMPVRADSQVTFLADGRHTMWTMCLHFLNARHSIHLANWGITPYIQLVRGLDHRAGPDGSSEQLALLEVLKAAGLAAVDIEFWTTQELTLQNVLSHAVRKGVDVKVLLWACPEVFSHYSPKTAYEQLTAVGVHCVMDDSSSGLQHISESLHQKISIIDGQYAFVGGIDPLIELSGDFDRWDTPWHSFISDLRQNPRGAISHTWHDAHSLIEGTAARDVEFNFYQRWNEVVQRHRLPQALLPEPDRTHHEALPHRLVQIARTIPPGTYRFAAKNGIQDIAQIHANAFSSLQQFAYLENQYFWLHTFVGIEIGDFGPVNFEMERNMRLLAQALEHGSSVIMVLPDHPNVGRAFTDKGLNHLRAQAPSAAAAGRIQIFSLATSTTIEGKEEYRPIYVHAKVTIVDDLWSTIGSANLNNRGMRDDAEINVAVLNRDFAHDLRIMLWAEHLGLIQEEEQFLVSRYLGHQTLSPTDSEIALKIWQALIEKLDNPASGLRLLSESAHANLEHFRKGEPLTGHLFPYLTAEEAHQLGLSFHESHGLFETPEVK
ncbi:MAG TPA: phospholipase D-like domain-containing protein [Ktedonobacteraceae bacterium]